MERRKNFIVVRLYRLACAATLLVCGLVVAAGIFPFVSAERKRRIISLWSARLNNIFHVNVAIVGTPPNAHTGPSMLVANHVSWLDIFVINAVCPMRFVAKIEIRGWPLVGWLCAQANTIFMVRAKAHELRRVNKTISDALVAGDRIAVFPEGTTTFGDKLEHFHASLLQPAVAAEAGLFPVAICYRCENGELSREAAYVGATSLIESLWAISGEKKIKASLTFLKPIPSRGQTRQILAREVERAISNQLGLRTLDKIPEIVSDHPIEPQSTLSPTNTLYLAQGDSADFANPVLTNVHKL